MLKNLMMGTAALALSAVGMASAANATLFTSSGLLSPCAEVDVFGAGTGFACTAASEAGTAPGASVQSGTFTISYDDVTKLLSILFAYTGLTALDGTVDVGTPTSNANFSNWHIHGPSTPDTNSFALLDGTLFFPEGGVLPDADNNPFSASLTISDATFSAFGLNLAAFEAILLGGQTYLNVHSTGYTQGELRAQLFDVPEPASMTLLGAGIMGLGYFGRRRKAA